MVHICELKKTMKSTFSCEESFFFENTERIRMWQNRTDFEEGFIYRRKGVAKFNGFSRSGLKYRIAFLLAFKLQSRVPAQNH